MSVKRTGIICPSLVEKISELMTFALTTPSEKADVFVEFSAHINYVDVKSYLGGWKSEADDDGWYRIQLPRSDDPELTTTGHVIEQIDNAIREIKEATK